MVLSTKLINSFYIRRVNFHEMTTLILIKKLYTHIFFAIGSSSVNDELLVSNIVGNIFLGFALTIHASNIE